MKKAFSALLALGVLLCSCACTANDNENVHITPTTTEGVASAWDEEENLISTTTNTIGTMNEATTTTKKVTTFASRTTKKTKKTTTTTKKATTTTKKATTTTQHYWHQWSDATCTKPMTCFCGATLGYPNGHDWESATCTAPKTCCDCGVTEGEKIEHDYRKYGDFSCSMCGKIDPAVTELLSRYSLDLPDLPSEVSYYSWENKVKSTVRITKIEGNFEYYGDGKVELTVSFDGEKLYDQNGAGQSSECRVGWKLYDPNDAVYKTGTFYSPSIAVGEKFSKKKETILYGTDIDEAVPGAYRLEILNVN